MSISLQASARQDILPNCYLRVLELICYFGAEGRALHIWYSLRSEGKSLVAIICAADRVDNELWVMI